MSQPNYVIDITPSAGTGPYEVKLSDVRAAGTSFISIETKQAGGKPSHYEERPLPFVPTMIKDDHAVIELVRQGSIMGLFDDTVGKLTAGELKSAVAKGFPDILETYATDILNKKPEASLPFTEYVNEKFVQRAKQQCSEVGGVLAQGECKIAPPAAPAAPTSRRSTGQSSQR